MDIKLRISKVLLIPYLLGKRHAASQIYTVREDSCFISAQNSEAILDSHKILIDLWIEAGRDARQNRRLERQFPYNSGHRIFVAQTGRNRSPCSLIYVEADPTKGHRRTIA